MSTLIIGCEGSMGTRYQAILEWLGERFIGIDKGPLQETIEVAQQVDNIILASPTETHEEILKSLLPLNKRILCEKPISKNLKFLESYFKILQKRNMPFNMMMQYSELVVPNMNGISEYDYFRTGKDGLFWDCLQIIGLAKGQINIKNKSPVWKCQINGARLNLNDMDDAYVRFVTKWLNGDIVQSLDYLFSVHEKVERFSRDSRTRIETDSTLN